MTECGSRSLILLEDDPKVNGIMHLTATCLFQSNGNCGFRSFSLFGSLGFFFFLLAFLTEISFRLKPAFNIGFDSSVICMYK